MLLQHLVLLLTCMLLRINAIIINVVTVRQKAKNRKDAGIANKQQELLDNKTKQMERYCK